MRIMFDAHPLLGKKTGVGYYEMGLIKALAAQYSQQIELIGYYHNFLGRKKVVNLPEAPNIKYRPVYFIPGQVVNLLRRFNIFVPIELLTLKKVDFILYPNFLGHPSIFGTPNAAVVHDLAFLDIPETASEKNAQDLTKFLPRQIKQSSFVITVSDFTKRRVVEEYKIDAKKIVTTFIPNVIEQKPSNSAAKQAVENLGIHKPYILFVGTVEPRKNITTLLQAYALLPEIVREAYSLVIAGKVDWKFEKIMSEIDELSRSGIDIHYLGYVSDEERASLYTRASLCAFPAFYEGFGMPVIESLNYGKPCVVSDIPAFREVGGDVVTYFPADQPKAMANALVQELQSPKHSPKELMQYAASKPGWEEVAESIYHNIEKAVKK